MAGMRSVINWDFTTYPTAPVARHSWTKSASECTVKKIIFAAQPDALNCLLASMPLRIGMEISVTMTSGLRCLAASKRDWPSGTLPTTSQVAASRFSTIIRNCEWSSAKSIRTLPNGSAYRMRGAKKALYAIPKGA
jgi:hypothetical protein